MPDDDPTTLRGASRVFTVQLGLCAVISGFLFILFCMVRRKWPHMYALRTLRESGGIVKPLPPGWFAWIGAVYNFSDEELLRVSGLDAYVFVAFFRMAISIFAVLTILAVAVLLPARYWTNRDDGVKNYHGAGNVAGNVAGDGSSNGSNNHSSSISWPQTIQYIILGMKDPVIPTYDGPRFFWLYFIATYSFLIILYKFIYKYTNIIIRVRQKYLALQNSITDRTILLLGIPKKLYQQNDSHRLAKFVELMGIGKVVDVKLIYDWTPLDDLFSRRKGLISDLEEQYAARHGLNIKLYTDGTPLVYPKSLDIGDEPTESKISDLRRLLANVDAEIQLIQAKYDPISGTITNYPQIPAAFVTMDLVALAQMAAQTVLDPRVHKLIVKLAPAPKDIRWHSFKLTDSQKRLYSGLVSFVIVILFLVLFFPISLILTLLNLKTIKRLWPDLGETIEKLKWATTFITGILPPLLFTIFNVLMPYFYQWLSTYQGYLLNLEVELSTLLKNFFYIFFNLFLVFTVTGTVSNFFGLIGDTTKLAYQLATSLQRLSLFYINLILLQGAMFPVKLLQVSDFLLLNVLGKVFFLRQLVIKTPREYRKYYYTPPIFDFGIQLPQHILIFIIVLIYLVVSTKIITCGLVYFILGYFVYKYQLIYSFVHPPHLTGRAWPMIFRRLILGMIIFQIFMCGTLALNDAYVLAALCVPLIPVLFWMLWNFENYYLPLLNFIALRALQNPFEAYDKEFQEDELQRSATPSVLGAQIGVETGGDGGNRDVDTSFLESGDELNFAPNDNTPLLRRRMLTLDEEREQSMNFVYPHIHEPLHGPWLGFEGNYVSLLQASGDNDYEEGDVSILLTTENETIVKRKLKVSEWE